MRLYRPKLIKVGYHPVMFDVHRHSESGDVAVLFCHVTSKDHIIKWSCDFISRSPATCVFILPSLVAIRTVVVMV